MTASTPHDNFTALQNSCRGHDPDINKELDTNVPTSAAHPTMATEGGEPKPAERHKSTNTIPTPDSPNGSSNPTSSPYRHCSPQHANPLAPALPFTHPAWTTSATDLLIPYFEEESGVSPEVLEQVAYLVPEPVKDELEEEVDVLLRIKDTYLLLVSSRCCCFIVGRVGGEEEMVGSLSKYAYMGEEGVRWFSGYQRVKVNRLWEFERKMDGGREGMGNKGRDGVRNASRLKGEWEDWKS